MSLGEADTRAKLIDPKIRERGWTEDHLKREVTAGTVVIVNGKPGDKRKGRMDYTLRLKVEGFTQPLAVALLEAKAENHPPAHGLQQAKGYLDACKRLNVAFAFASNGHLFVEFDSYTGLTTAPRPLSEFPTTDELRARYEAGRGFKLTDSVAKPLLTPYQGGETSRRYYQDAALRAVLEKLARCELEAADKRALLSLATGSGKTFIAVHLLRRLADAGQLKSALFVCDRDALRGQGLGALMNVFGSDAAEVYRDKDGKNHARNARIHVATYQTLDQDGADGANLLAEFYPENYFSHIIIDECHRSAWTKWFEVLKRNPKAAHIGLTATPRRLQELTGRNTKPGFGNPGESEEGDARLLADNLKYFGEPVYEYGIGQGIEDGYLAACEIFRFDLFHDNKAVNERDTPITKAELATKTLTHADTGAPVSADSMRDTYGAPDIEERITLPERVATMTQDFFNHLLATGGPEQKTILFCARDRHADAVATAMNNLYAKWCAANGRPRLDHYAFKCTGSSGGAEMLPDLAGSQKSHFIATTVNLLEYGVDVPCVRNIVFFKYVRSPITFYQMVGRGTRLDPATDKLMFRVYDYTDATRLFGEAFITKVKPRDSDGPDSPPPPPDPVVQVEGIEVEVRPAGRFILTQVDGRAMPVTVEEYRERMAAKLVRAAPSLDVFRQRWVQPAERRDLIAALPEAGRSAIVLQTLDDMLAYDLFDVLAEVGYGLAPRTRVERADAFNYKHAAWLRSLPPPAAGTLRAVAQQFARAGTDGLESRELWELPEVRREGGLAALRTLGKPSAVLLDAKERMFAA